MKQIFFERHPEVLLLLFFGTIVLFGWLAFLLALAHAFLPALVLPPLLVFGAFFLFFLGRLLYFGNPVLRLSIALALVMAVITGLTAVPTIFSGRDQGAISEAAYRLSETGSLYASESAALPFFELYGPGAALNFPGFSYTIDGNLLTQFPLAYTSFLAGFITGGDIHAIAVANGVLFFGFLLALFALLTRLAAPFYGFLAVAVAAFSFLPTWFTKFTLSENYALFLFTLLSLATLAFFKRPERLSYGLMLLAAGLLIFTRIEGLVIFGLLFILLLAVPGSRSFLKEQPLVRLALPLLFLALIFARNFFLNLPYYKVMGKALLDKLSNSGSPGGSGEGGGFLDLWQLFFTYGLGLLFLAGILSLLFLAWQRKYLALLPAYLALPTFLYFITPSITLDHPWMLRRYLFTLYPVLLVSATLGLGLLFSGSRALPVLLPQGTRRAGLIALFLVLIASSWPAWQKTIAFAEHRGLREEMEELLASPLFGPRDLILVDRLATGSGFAMITGPTQYLTKRDAVYFFNPQDIERLDLEPYDKIWLVAPVSERTRYESFWGERLKVRDTFTFRHVVLAHSPLSQSAAFPEKKVLETPNLIFEVTP